MDLYIDTEFNGHRGQLISMGLVAKDDSTIAWYKALPLPSMFEDIDPWVARNVLPVLYVEPVGLHEFHSSLEAFLSQFPSVHIVADWPEDIQWFCWSLITGPGTRIATPPLTLEIRRDLHTNDSVTPHNALADAHALREMAISKGK